MSVLTQRIRLVHRAYRYRLKLDPTEIGLVKRLMPRGGGAIDMGAHKGAYTWWLARSAGRGGRVVAVEPQRNLADRLKPLLANMPQVEVVWGAVADRSGEIQLSLRGDGSSHGASIAGFDDEPEARTVAVPCYSVADLARRVGGRVDFIKCDVEGAELDVFGASGEVIERDKPAVLVECEARHGGDEERDRVRELEEMFLSRGYEGFCVYGSELVPLDRFEPTVHQVYGSRHYGNNFLFEHPSR